MITATIPAGDATSLLVHSLQPAGIPAGDVLIVHGLGEHSGRWLGVARRLQEAGLAVHAFDQRGFGRSGGRRAWLEHWDDLLDDLAVVVGDRVPAERPFVIYGHSMGGLVALGYALSDRRRPDRLVLSAPSIDAAVPALKRAAARVLARVSPRIAIRNDITGEQLAGDPVVGEAYFADPLVLTRTTARLGLEFLRAMHAARSALPQLSIPTLVVHGGADTLVPPGVSAPLGELPCVQRIVLPGLRHEWHNEPGRGEAALGTVIDWILAGL